MKNSDKSNSNWLEEIDQFGVTRRYRINSGIKEYEMMIRRDGIEIPQSELETYNKQKRASEQAREEAEKKTEASPPRKYCPFLDGLTSDCERDRCALFINGCTLAKLSSRTPVKLTEGMRCPINRYHIKCRRDCALFKETGCALTAINTESEDNSK